MIWLTIVVFAGMLLVLVLAHEAGHLMAAKLAGCKVEEFGFGFPPRLFSKIWAGTRYSFNLLPLGGFVKIEGENMDDVPADDGSPSPTSFASKSAAWRIFILAAGVLMNVILAYLLLTVQAGVGAPVLVTEENFSELTEHKTYILDVAEGSPAASVELQEFDRLVEIGGIENPTIEQVQSIVARYAGQEVPLEVDRAGKKHTAYVLAREAPPEGEGAFGVSLASTGLKKTPWWQAPLAGFTRTRDMLVAIIFQFGVLVQRIASEGVVSDSFTGPVGIAVYTNEATQLGLPYLLEFTALISLNLAIINILPIPALDGGRIIFVIAEKFIRRRWLNLVESKAHAIGFVLLIGLMIFITFKDVQKYFS